MDARFVEARNDSYEGLVLRSPESLYVFSDNNKRSKDTLKYKQRDDIDVQVFDFYEGQGKDKGAVIFICRNVSSDRSFTVVQNTTLAVRQR